MVKIMENPIKMDDLGGFPLFLVQHPYQGLNLGSEQDWLVSILMRIHEHVSNECEDHDDPYETREIRGFST